MDRESLLQSIKPDMKLTPDFFKAVYGFDISFSGFAEDVLQRLENVGFHEARKCYQEWLEEYGSEHDQMLRNVASQFRKEMQRKDERKRREDLAKWKKFFQTADKETLRMYLTILSERGVDIKQFVTEVLQSH